MKAFEYCEPSTIADALTLLQRHGTRARVLAGGTDLLIALKERVDCPEYIVALRGIPGLAGFDDDPTTGLHIGPMVTMRTLETSAVIRARYPVLAGAARTVASMQIRNLATVGGNICRASPSADMAPPLIALGAQALIAGPLSERSVPLEQFFIGPGRTVLEQDELLVGLRVPASPPASGAAYVKHGRRAAVDLALVGVAAMVILSEGRFRDVRIVLGAVAPTPLRAASAEALLRGREPHESLLAEAGRAAAADSRPISDVRASAEYRREMVEVLTRRALDEAMAQVQAEGAR